MTHIQTKLTPNGKWYCFGTIKGYDYSFEGKDMVDAQDQMRKFLHKEKVFNVTWDDVIIHQPPVKIKTSKWRPPKLDNL